MNQLWKWTLVGALTLACGFDGPAQSSRAPKTPAVPSSCYSKPKIHTETISSSERRYSINVGGHLDFSNSSTREHNDWLVSFQPNLSLTLENVGETVVKNPGIAVNGRGDWRSMEQDLGDHSVKVRVDTYYPHEISPWLNNGTRAFSKAGARFLRQAWHEFIIRVTR